MIQGAIMGIIGQVLNIITRKLSGKIAEKAQEGK